MVDLYLSEGARAAFHARQLEEDARKAEILELEKTPRGAEMLSLSCNSVLVARLPFLLRIRNEDVQPEGRNMSEKLASVGLTGARAPRLEPDLRQAFEDAGYYGKVACAALERHMSVDAQIETIRREDAPSGDEIIRFLDVWDKNKCWSNASTFSLEPGLATKSAKRGQELQTTLEEAALHLVQSGSMDHVPDGIREPALSIVSRVKRKSLTADLVKFRDHVRNFDQDHYSIEMIKSINDDIMPSPGLLNAALKEARRILPDLDATSGIDAELSARLRDTKALEGDILASGTALERAFKDAKSGLDQRILRKFADPSLKATLSQVIERVRMPATPGIPVKQAKRKLNNGRQLSLQKEL